MTAIVVLGAGPAGAAVAMGLRRLGYPVTLISEWRRFAALEGISQRVLEALRAAGLQRAVADAVLPSQRQVVWNGQHHAQNIEWLLDRPCFDRGLREDLRLAGVDVIEARVLAVASSTTGHRISLEGREPLQADFLVEARGRQAPAAGKGLRGPETVNLLNRWLAMGQAVFGGNLVELGYPRGAFDRANALAAQVLGLLRLEIAAAEHHQR